MQGQKPLKLYFFVTFLLILAVLMIGLTVKEYLAQKYPPKQTIEQKPKLKKSAHSDSFEIVDLAVSVSLVLLLLFVVVKIFMTKLRKV